MSYEIFYQKAFIKIEEKYLPIIQQGSNNCWSYNRTGRSIPEKVWGVFNFRKKGQFLFSKDEIKEIAKQIELVNQEDTNIYKSRYRIFEKNELEKWFNAGMKSAKSVEEYISKGNELFILDNSDWNNRTKFPVNSTIDLVNKLNELLEKTKTIDISFKNRNLNK